MGQYLRALFASDFMPHASWLGQPDIIRIHAWPDILIAVSYFLILISFFVLVRRRRDLAFSWMFLLFSAFILGCGTTHLLAVWTLWHPIYRFEGLVKAITALVSLPVALLLIRLVPREIAERQRAGDEAARLNADLESRAAERAAALVESDRLLAASERRRLMAVEAAEMGTWQWNLTDKEIFCDSRCRTLFDIPADEAVTYERFLESIHRDDRSITDACLRTRFENSQEYEIEYRTARRGQREEWIRAKGCCESGGAGGAKQVLGIFINVTESKRAELAAFRLAAIVESSSDAIIGKDLQGTITTWNRGAEMLFGFTADEAIGQSISILRASGWVDEMPRILEDVRRGVTIDRYETVRRRKDGKEVAISLTVSPIHDTAGRIIGASKSAHEITDRKRLDQALRASEQRFRTLAEAVPDMLFSAVPDGSITFVSARFQEYSGLSLECGDGVSVWEQILDPQDEALRAHTWKVAVLTGKPFEMECQIRRKDGVYRWFVVRALPVQDSAESATQWLGSCTEIHYLKTIETALRHSREELRQFAYAAAHDLQEPLRNVVNAAGMLARITGQQMDGMSAVLLKECIEGGERMHGMVKDLLAYTTAVEGIEPVPTLTDANEIVEDVRMNLKTAIAEASGEIQCDRLPVIAVGYMHAVQLFQHLIGNAVKYRRAGVAPVIRLSAVRNKADWVFSVADNGIGFDPKYEDRLFKVFKRLHKRHEYTGTGIGLAICARIVGHYGGRIWAQGRPGDGSTFYFTVPVADNER
jgi:PAS domain S-box-containing protein